MSSRPSLQSPRIALIHASRAAMQPSEDAFAELWPEAERINLLDDSLGIDLERDAKLTIPMFRRFRELTEYAESIGAHGILYTCSAFGEAIEAARASRSMPILKSHEAMYLEAIERGARVALLGTFEPSLALMRQEFMALVRDAGRDTVLETICVPEARFALEAGDATSHDELLAARATELGTCDAVMLAQFSTARAAPAIQRAIDEPVLTAPAAAVQLLKQLLVTAV